MSKTHRDICKWKIRNSNFYGTQCLLVEGDHQLGLFKYAIWELSVWHDREIARKYGMLDWWYNANRSEPHWWRNLKHIRPSRRRNHAFCLDVVTGRTIDRLDGLPYPLNNKPHIYYW